MSISLGSTEYFRRIVINLTAYNEGENTAVLPAIRKKN
jgi:hypothetical protein